jgi:hypothetical protein
MTDAKKNGVLVEPTTMRFERLLPGPIERVWEYLTKPELLTTWLSVAAAIDVREGGKVELTMDHGEPGKLPEDVKAKLVDADKITPKVHGEDVLVLTHRRIIPKFAPQALGGWHTLLDLLEAQTRGEPAFDFFDRFEDNLKRYAALSPS